MHTEKPAEMTTKEKVATTSASQAKAWGTLVQPWWLATLAVLPTFLITRLIFLLLTYFGGVLFVLPNYSTSHLSTMDVIYSWYHWDAIRFVSIATKGYTSLQYAAFFPLFPAMERALSKVLHDVLISGMLISNLAFLGTLIILYRLTDTEFDRETAQRTVLYLSIFPTALFFFAAYNESLFLFLALASFYALRRGSWWLAGLFGFLATLTRSIGLFLIIIFLYEYTRQCYRPLRQTWQNKEERTSFLLQLANLAAIALIPLALALYAYGLKQHFGDPLAFMHAQVSWRLGLTFPLVAPGRALKFLFTESPFTFTSPHLIIDLTALALFALLLILCFVGPVKIERHQWSFALFGVMALTYALLFPGIPGAPGVPYDPIPSSERFVLEIFIGFIIMARLGRRQWFHQGYLLLALPMLTFLTLQFMTGHWTI